MQPDLFTVAPRFDGPDLTPDDEIRLNRQQLEVLHAMRDGQWRTLGQIAGMTHAPEASVSARLRDLRKPRFGGWCVERRRVSDAHGLYQYRVVA